MDRQTLKSRCKQRVVDRKGGLDRGLSQSNLSGAYIRSLVKQLTSSKNHVHQGGLKTELPKSCSSSTQAALHIVDSGTRCSSSNADHVITSPSRPNFEDNNRTQKLEVGSSINPVCVEQKKKVRRRPHSRKTSQDFPFDIVEARREIVSALHLHRAAAKTKLSARSQTDQKSSNNCRTSSNHSTSLYIQSADTSSPDARCNSCMSKDAANLHKASYMEATAITICGHLLCWTCLSEYSLYLSIWVVKGCPVCAKPLTANQIFPIALGVPNLDGQTATCTTSVLLQSAPLLINPLPLPQPAWSTTGPSLGVTRDGISSTIDISQRMNMNYISQSPTVLHQSLTVMDNATTAAFAMASQSPKSGTASVNLEQGHSINSNWHVAMDEEELAEIRCLGEQHEMEWSDTVNLATTSWWFKFLKTLEFNPDMNMLYQTDIDRSDYNSLDNLLMQDEVGFYPELLQDPLRTINENLYISSEPPAESLWPDEWFDYDWFQDLKNQKDYSEILPELDENHWVPSSEVFKDNNCACVQVMSDDTTDLHSDLSTDNPENNARVSVGDKRRRDS